MDIKTLTVENFLASSEKISINEQIYTAHKRSQNYSALTNNRFGLPARASLLNIQPLPTGTSVLTMPAVVAKYLSCKENTLEKNIEDTMSLRNDVLKYISEGEGHSQLHPTDVYSTGSNQGIQAGSFLSVMFSNTMRMIDIMRSAISGNIGKYTPTSIMLYTTQGHPMTIRWEYLFPTLYNDFLLHEKQVCYDLMTHEDGHMCTQKVSGANLPGRILSNMLTNFHSDTYCGIYMIKKNF